MPRTHSTYPLFPTDDGWPYPDGTLAEAIEPVADDDIDLDALELRADPHAFANLTPEEHEVLFRRFGLRGPALSMKELSRSMGCSHADARECLGRAIEKMRARLTAGEGLGDGTG
jgi:DNA-directed RNA polymerase sigma subunit (sigma70/sigma32)